MFVKITDPRTESCIANLFKSKTRYNKALHKGYLERDVSQGVMNIKVKVEDSRDHIYASVWVSLSMVKEVES